MDDLDALLADLGGASVQPTAAPAAQLSARQHVPYGGSSVARAPPPAQSAGSLDDLDSLMNELSATSAPSPATSRQGSLAEGLVARQPTASSPLARGASSGGGASGGLDDLDALLNDVAGVGATAASPAVSHTVDDLDCLLNELNDGGASGTLTKPTVSAPPPAVTHNLSTASSAAPRSPGGSIRRAPVRPRVQSPAAFAGLSTPAPASARIPSPSPSPSTVARPAVSTDMDDLDSLLGELNAAPAATPPPTVAPASVADDSLDSLMQELSMDVGPTSAPPPSQAPVARVGSMSTGHRGGAMPAPAVDPSTMGNMIAHLRGEMTSLDPSAPNARGICHACSRAIHGEVVAACGRSYHPGHFTCNNCQQSLSGQNFYDQDGEPQCQRCYANTYCAKCAYCNQSIASACITAMNKRYHPEHFICVGCLKPFQDGLFYERDGAPYCAVCYQGSSGYTCAGCQGVITGDVINALGKHWHPEHFVCATCSCAFGGGVFYSREGKPYCKDHYQMESGANCAECGHTISGRVVNALNKRFHPKCFCCQFCMQELGGQGYEIHENQPYCRPCASRMF